jgi:hypothetical protein
MIHPDSIVAILIRYMYIIYFILTEKEPYGLQGQENGNSNILQKNGDFSRPDEPTKTSISLNESGTEGSSIPLDVEVKFVYLILRSLQSSQFNAHETSGWDPHRTKDNSVSLGGGVFPTLALFNHSCNPAIVR